MRRLACLTMLNALRTSVSAILFAVVFFFWLFMHPEALSFHEQYQMFLTTWAYLSDHLSVVGGMAEYIAEFFVQFCYYPAAGAALLALLFLLIQVATWRVASQMSNNAGNYALSTIPSFLMLAIMSDENVKPTLLVALIMSTFAAAIYGRMWTFRSKLLCHVVAVPLIYWLCGPAAIVYVLLSIAVDIKRNAALLSLAFIPYLAVIVFVASQSLMSQYATPDILFGQNYHNLRLTHPASIFVAEASLVVVPLIISLLPHSQNLWLEGIEALVVLVTGSCLSFKQYATPKYDAIALDALVRSEKWDGIISRAKVCNPKDETSLAAVNLALAQKGQLLDSMFCFQQVGPQGLLARSHRDQFSSITTAEALFRLGMVNMAQHYFFDLQEAIIDCHKSSRFSKRIAETLIINGRYEMARKYTNRLNHTLFYSPWASRASRFLGDDNAVNNHPVWGRLRKIRYQDSFAANYYEIDKMLAILYNGNKSNRLALDYFLAQCLLRRDLRTLWSGLAWAQEAYGDNLPRHIQEAVAFTWTQSHNSFDGIPVTIAPDVLHNLANFARLYSSNKADTRLDAPRFRHTYWHYLLLEKPVDANSGATSIANDEQVR